ncbi:hypothetical protein LUR56_00935 [Streptomyces sp. MT29]|nr:hypothetical protein [Streptomyces sp. MT29]
MKRTMGTLAAVGAGIALALSPLQAHAVAIPGGCASSEAKSSSGDFWAKVTLCLTQDEYYNQNQGRYDMGPAIELKVECSHKGLLWSSTHCQARGTEHLAVNGTRWLSNSFTVNSNPHGRTTWLSHYKCRGYGTYTYTVDGLSVVDLVPVSVGGGTSLVHGESATLPAVTATGSGC